MIVKQSIVNYFTEVGADAHEDTIHKGTDPALTVRLDISACGVYILITHSAPYVTSGNPYPGDLYQIIQGHGQRSARHCRGKVRVSGSDFAGTFC